MGNQRSKVVFFFLTIILGTALLFGLGSSATAKDEIRIGFSMALTGRNAPAAAGQIIIF